MKRPYLKNVVCLLLIGIIGNSAFSQKEKIKYSTKSKSAISHYEAAGEHFDNKRYFEAEEELASALKADSLFVEAHLMLAAVCTDAKKPEKAIVEYEAAIRISPNFFKNMYYSLAMLLLDNGYFQKAKDNFQKFLSFDITHSGLLKKSKLGIEICDFAIYEMNHPKPFNPINLGNNINTEFGEYSPAITADEQTIFFTFLKPLRGFNREEQIYFSMKTDTGWLPAIGVGAPVNAEGNEGTVNIAPDGQTLYFTACDRPDGVGSCDIYEVKRNGKNWSTPVNLGPIVNSRYFDSQPSISSDGKTLYFTSNRPGGLGNSDIWKTEKNNTGTWSIPTNLGPEINCEGKDQSPFIHPDNQTLYFISDGRIGFGGNDFYFSKRNEKGEWGKPVNMGYPINSIADERNIIVNAKGDYAYMSSDRFKTKDDFDIYGFELYQEARPQKVSYLKGRVFDKVTSASLEARFELIDISNGKVIIQSYSNKQTGEFLVCLPTGKEYALNVSCEGYLFYSDHFNMTANENKSEEPFKKDVPMHTKKAGEIIVLKNIFFESNSFALKSESNTELNLLLQFMENNPNIKIEIGGHTDQVGEDKSNLILSENRAKAVADYLLQSGIAAERIRFKGYGETMPVATNDTDEGRAQNRRTEFKILE